MTEPLGLLSYLQSSGAHLSVEGENIRCRVPKDLLSDSLKSLVGRHKLELMKMLQSQQKFDSSEAALFPLLGKPVSTPQGSGELLSVSQAYARVQIHRTGQVVLCSPGDLIAFAVNEFRQEMTA